MANPQHIEWLMQGVDAWNERRQADDFEPDLESANLVEVLGATGDFHRAGRPSLSGINLSDANLMEANLSGIWLIGANFANSHLLGANLGGCPLAVTDFTDADLESANLAGANLTHSNLTRANFQSADLSDSLVVFSNLSGTSFWLANLSNSELGGCDLTDADLSDAVTTGANFAYADFTDTNLIDADLSNAKLSGSQIWEACLFDPSHLSPEQYKFDGVIGRPISVMEDVIKIIRRFRKQYPSDVMFYFRGECKCGWDLRPSVMRDGLVALESDMLIALTSKRPEEFVGMTSALSRWVLAQHHGLKTRFLDVTKNPLVALFHACADGSKENGRLHLFVVPKSLVKPFNSDTISVISNFANLPRNEQDLILSKKLESAGELSNEGSKYRAAMRHLCQLVRSEKPYFEDRINISDLFRVFVVEPQQSDERIRSQSGAFLMSAFHERFERDEILKWNEEIPIYSHYMLTIPSDSKSHIIDDLKLLNITRETLFPGLDSSALAITELYGQSR